MDLLFSICVAALGGSLGGVLVSVGLRFAINRRCYHLEIVVADLQRVVASLKGVEYGARRWKKAEKEAEELAEMLPRNLPRQPEPAMKYDNDWSTGRPD